MVSASVFGIEDAMAKAVSGSRNALRPVDCVFLCVYKPFFNGLSIMMPSAVLLFSETAVDKQLPSRPRPRNRREPALWRWSSRGSIPPRTPAVKVCLLTRFRGKKAAASAAALR
jgi:hypothetical protein